MKILITGCKGQLGTEIQKQLRLGYSEIGPIPECLQNAEIVAVEELENVELEAVEEELVDLDEIEEEVEEDEPEVVEQPAKTVKADIDTLDFSNLWASFGKG